jgi:hypothetical protein
MNPDDAKCFPQPPGFKRNSMLFQSRTTAFGTTHVGLPGGFDVHKPSGKLVGLGLGSRHPSKKPVTFVSKPPAPTSTAFDETKIS